MDTGNSVKFVAQIPYVDESAKPAGDFCWICMFSDMFLTSEWIALHNHLENGFICLKIAKGKFWRTVQEKNRSEFVQFIIAKEKKTYHFPYQKNSKAGKKTTPLQICILDIFRCFSGRPGENPKRMMKIGPDRTAWSQRANRPLTWPQETLRCSTDQLRMGFQGGSWRWHGKLYFVHMYVLPKHWNSGFLVFRRG